MSPEGNFRLFELPFICDEPIGPMHSLDSKPHYRICINIYILIINAKILIICEYQILTDCIIQLYKSIGTIL